MGTNHDTVMSRRSRHVKKKCPFPIVFHPMVSNGMNVVWESITELNGDAKSKMLKVMSPQDDNKGVLYDGRKSDGIII